MIIEGLGRWHLPVEYMPFSGAKAEKESLNEENGKIRHGLRRCEMEEEIQVCFQEL